MVDHAHYRNEDAQVAQDPSSLESRLGLFESGIGKDGAPFVVLVTDPPHHTRPVHRHHADVVYVYVAGEHQVEGEGTYRAGDLRWVRGGHTYGPETTGPDGGSWWVVSAADPTPVTAASTRDRVNLQDFGASLDWDEVDASVFEDGAAVVRGLIEPSLLSRLNEEIDRWLDAHPGEGLPGTGSPVYDDFLGRRTVRLHGLCAKLASAAEFIGHRALVSWAERLLFPRAASIRLNAGELIEIGPGEPAQFLHRDSDSWPLPVGDDPLIVNAMVALTPFRGANGTTRLALGSHRWAAGRYPAEDEVAQVDLEPGDVLLFRGDVVHGGGANTTPNESRRGLSISYCVGWLRPVENSLLNVPPDLAVGLPAEVQDLLGYATHDATASAGGVLGLFENGDPHRALRTDGACASS